MSGASENLIAMLGASKPFTREEQDRQLARFARLATKYGPESRQAVAVRNRIVQANLRLVASIAQKYRCARGLTLDDLIAMGVPGLITAVERFDAKRGCQLSTFAGWWIRHAIGRALADTEGSLVRVPVHAKDALAREARGDTSKPVPKALEDARAARRVSSLDAPVRDGDGRAGTFVDLMAAPDDVDPVAARDGAFAAQRIAEEIEALPEKYRGVVRGRFYEGHTLKEIGDGFGRSRERARQLEAEALAMLRPKLWDVADLANGT